MIAIILAILSSVLSIFAPNKLSDLTDEISKGLVVNKDNLEKLSSNIQDNLSKKISNLNVLQNQQSDMTTEIPEEMKNILFEDLEIDGVKISVDDQYEFVKK